MTTFITIMKFTDGLAAYQVNETKCTYQAQLLRSTSLSALPVELIVKKSLQNDSTSQDVMMQKLMQAIRMAESNQE